MTDNDGALPSLDGRILGRKGETAGQNTSDEVLGRPEGRMKAKTNVNKLFILAVMLIVITLLIVGVISFVKGRSTRQAAVEKERQEQTFRQRNEALENAKIEAQKFALMAKQKEDEERERARAAALAAAEAERLAELERNRLAASRQAAPPPDKKAKPEPPAGPTPHERKMSGSVLVSFDRSDSRPATATPASASSPSQQTFTGSDNDSPYKADSRPLGARLQSTVLSARAAYRLPDLDYLLKKGTEIPCALKTGIDTSLPGFVLCNVITDVYSANGKTLLVDRGASLFGEQQSSLKHGQARTFIIWSRVDNPSGVSASLDSPGVDQMGFSGIPGYVDTHFLERFGGAIMLSLIKDFGAYYANRQGNNYFSNSSDSAENMATETLKNTINIPPSLVVNPGTIVHVLVARDVTFEPVFELIR